MIITLARLHNANLVYIPAEFLEDSGLNLTKTLTIEIDRKKNKIILTPISEKLASEAKKKVVEIESKITEIRRSQTDLHKIKVYESEKEDYLKNLQK